MPATHVVAPAVQYVSRKGLRPKRVQLTPTDAATLTPLLSLRVYIRGEDGYKSTEKRCGLHVVWEATDDQKAVTEVDKNPSKYIWYVSECACSYGDESCGPQ